MGKITTYLAMLSMIVLGFHFSGILTSTPNGVLLNTLLNPQNIQSSTFFSELNGIIAGLAVAGIVAGTILAQRFENALTVSFVSFLFLIGIDIVAIYLVLNNINHTLAVLIFAPIILLYMLSAIEWFRGKD